MSERDGFALERLDVAPLAGRWGVVRMLAALSEQPDIPRAPRLVIERPEATSAHGAFVNASDRRGSQLLWLASFAVPLEVVRHPDASFTLTAPGHPAVALPVPGTFTLPLAARAELRLARRLPHRSFGRRATALATALAFSASTAPLTSLAAAKTPSTLRVGHHDSPAEGAAPGAAQRVVLAQGTPSDQAPVPLSTQTAATAPPASSSDPSAPGATGVSGTTTSTTTTATTSAPAPTPPPPATHKPVTPDPLTAAPKPDRRGGAHPHRAPGRNHGSPDPTVPAVGWSTAPEAIAGPAPDPLKRTRRGHHKPTARRGPLLPTGGAPIPTLSTTPPALTHRRREPVVYAPAIAVPADTGGPGGVSSAPLSSIPPAALLARIYGDLQGPPPFLVAIYKQAENRYHVPWQILAAINSVETNYGRDLSVSSAGAEGWMQFMPETWAQWGVDANGDGKKDPYDPRDAIFAAARYLQANGAPQRLREAIFAYNHANWYVEDVMRRAQWIADTAGVPVRGKEGAMIKAMKAKADELLGLPYVWGGGHGGWQLVGGYDCSGFVSTVLHAGGYLGSPQTTDTLPGQQGIAPGPGRYVTIFDRTGSGGHVIIDLDGTFYESGGSASDGGGAGVKKIQPPLDYLVTFNTILHPRGL